MIKLLKRHELNRAKYDLCIALDPLGIPYGESAYLDALCDWEVLVLNDYDAVWPLPVRNKFGLKYYYRPFGLQQLGIFSKKPLDEGQMRSFQLSLAQSARYADLYLNEGQLPLGLPAYKFSSLDNAVLSLQGSYELVYEGYNSNLKRKLKRLNSEQQLSVFTHDGPEVLLRLFKQNKGEALDLSNAFYSSMERAMYSNMHKGKGLIYTVYGAGNELLAGAYILKGEHRHVFLFSALSEEGREKNAMPYLLNEHLIYYSGKVDYFDFEGSMDPGTMRFYESFGAKRRTYYRLLLNRLPWPLNWMAT